MCLDPFYEREVRNELDRVIIAGERSMMIESCVRIQAKVLYSMAPLDCYKRNVHNGMVPHMLTMSRRFI